jgi:hypothetical protein
LIDKENAVSENIGFMLILTIVLLSLGIITIYAQPILDKSKDDIYFSNMEQSFTLLHSDVTNIASGISTIKTRDMNLINAPIIFNPESTHISITPETHKPIIFNAGSIEYDMDGYKVCLENGALLSHYKTGSFMIQEPLIYTTTNTDGQATIIHLIMLDGPGFSAGGKGIVRIIEQKNYTESYMSQSTENVTIKIESTYADGWAHYFEKQGFSVTPGINALTATINGTRLRIYGTVIGISNEKALPVHSPDYTLEPVITTSGEISEDYVVINATINNTGNQDMNNVNARLDVSDDAIHPAVQPVGNIPAGSSSNTFWNVSTHNQYTEFIVTVNGTGNSSWVNPTQFQGRSNKIWIAS